MEHSGPRAAHRAATLAKIHDRAWTQLAEQGADGLSLRAIARDLGMVSSAIYRYYASRDDLITALIVAAYTDLAEALEARRADGFVAVASALRTWAVAFPARFGLIYGTAVPGYAAPEATIEPAVRVARAFAAAAAPVVGPHDALTTDLAPGAEALTEGLGLTAYGPEVPVVILLAFAELIGLITLELGGHLVGTYDDASPLYAAAVRRLSGGCTGDLETPV